MSRKDLVHAPRRIERSLAVQSLARHSIFRCMEKTTVTSILEPGASANDARDGKVIPKGSFAEGVEEASLPTRQERILLRAHLKQKSCFLASSLQAMRRRMRDRMDGVARKAHPLPRKHHVRTISLDDLAPVEPQPTSRYSITPRRIRKRPSPTQKTVTPPLSYPTKSCLESSIAQRFPWLQNTGEIQ